MLAAAPILTGTITGDGTSTTLTQTLSPTLSVPEQAGGLLDARAITLQVANNSGQSMTALTVLLQDTVGGLPVSASYPVSMTANLATGAAGQYLVTLWGSGIGSVVAVQATFASAPASAATVSLRAIVQTAGAAGVSLVGSIAPNATNSLGQVLSIPYTDLNTATTTFYYYYTGLHPNAKRRLVIVGPDSAGGWNTSSSPPYCTVGVFVWNSSLLPANHGQVGNAPHVRAPSLNIVANIARGYAAQWDSLSIPQIGAPGDTLIVSVDTGTLLPTMGQDNVWVLEVL